MDRGVGVEANVSLECWTADKNTPFFDVGVGLGVELIGFSQRALFARLSDYSLFGLVSTRFGEPPPNGVGGARVSTDDTHTPTDSGAILADTGPALKLPRPPMVDAWH